MVWNLSGTGTIIDNGKNSFISGFGDLDNSTAILLDANANEIIKVNGIEYSIKNRQAVQRALFYSVNAVTDEVSFAGIYVDIKGQDDVEHNVNLYGFRPVSYTHLDVYKRQVINLCNGITMAGMHSS